MTKEERDLLIRDLCSRLPYGVIIEIDYLANDDWHSQYPLNPECDTLKVVDLNTGIVITNGYSEYNIEEVKPYLHPMSGMTEEERKEFQAFHCVDGWHPEFYQAMCNLPNINNMINWLDKKMFDHRGLIPKGLALEAPEGMYNVN